MKDILKRMQNRIMNHQTENGFESVFDFLNEDIEELQEKVSLNPCKLSHCSCVDEDKHGETSIMCCNECGKPTEEFWHEGMDEVVFTTEK
jgi:hypothetical protein